MNKSQLTNSEISSFFDNMGVMLKAGITTEEAVQLLIEDQSGEDTLMLTCLKQMSGEMSMGTSFTDALKNTEQFPDYAVSMAEAAEYTGNLESTLYHLGEYYRNEESTARTLRAAIRYPVSLLSMIIVLLIVMLVLVFPAFRDVYNNLSGSLAASSFKYINTSFVVCEVLLVITILLVVALLTGLSMWKRGKREGIRRFLGKSRMFSRIFEGFDLYRFTSCFNMFLASGELQDEALKKSVEVAETGELRSKLGKCMEEMKEGKSFSQAACSQSLYDSISNRLLIPAERSGNLDTVLKNVTEGLKEKNTENVSRIANMIEPVLTGLLLISIGLMLISLMIPLIGIMNSIG